jgi:hypothetical protein
MFLSIPMVVIGSIAIVYSMRKQQTAETKTPHGRA